MKFKYFIPFLLFIILTPIITYFTWESHVWESYPKEEMRGIIGLCIMWFFVGVTYFSGIQAILNDKMKENNAKKLRELKKLKDEGLLTDEEYEVKRKAIIDAI